MLLYIIKCNKGQWGDKLSEADLFHVTAHPKLFYIDILAINYFIKEQHVSIIIA